MKKEIPLTEEQKAVASQIKLKMMAHLHLHNGGLLSHSGKYKDVEIIREIWTPKRGDFNWGKGKATYYFGSEKKGYKNLAEFIDELIKRTS